MGYHFEFSLIAEKESSIVCTMFVSNFRDIGLDGTLSTYVVETCRGFCGIAVGDSIFLSSSSEMRYAVYYNGVISFYYEQPWTLLTSQTLLT